MEKKATGKTLVRTQTEGEVETIRDKNCVKYRVKDSLKRSIDFWENELKASSFVLDIIRGGYVIPFTKLPPVFYAKNNQSAMKNATFVEEAIETLLESQFITEISGPAHCCNPLSVSEKGKLRLVLDLRHVNQFIALKSFRYEDLKCVAEMLEQGDYFIQFDLTSGYYHVNIHPEHHKYLGLHWKFGDKIRYFQFTVLVFGLSPASYVFTKITRPLTKRWRSQGIKSVTYIDDGIAADSTKELTGKVESDLKRAGFSINWEKSSFSPRQKGEWLGTIIDTRAMTFSVPAEKIAKLKQDITTILGRQTCTTKDLARIAGKLSAMHLAIGPLVRLFTRSMYCDIASANSWYQRSKIGKKSSEELTFWLNHIQHFNGCTFSHRPTTTQMLFTDASENGYGGSMVQRMQKLLCSGKFER